METLVSELRSKEARVALAAVLRAAFERWGLPPDKQAALLGVPDIAPLRQDQPLPDDPAVLERAGHLLAVDRALRARYREQAVLRDPWLLWPWPQLGGQSALALMLTGGDGIKRVRELVETEDAEIRER